MTGPIFVIRSGPSGLLPADDNADERLRKWKRGEALMIDARRPRNLKHHRQWWAVIRTIYPYQDYYPTERRLHIAIKAAIGLGETFELPDGRLVVDPGSTAFDAMQQEEYEQFRKQAERLLFERIAPKLPAPVVDRVLQILQGNSH